MLLLHTTEKAVTWRDSIGAKRRRRIGAMTGAGTDGFQGNVGHWIFDDVGNMFDDV
jgi:hypothetical protein